VREKVIKRLESQKRHAIIIFFLFIVLINFSGKNILALMQIPVLKSYDKKIRVN